MSKKKKNTEKILFCGKSDMGRVRTNNEDAFIVQNIWDNRTVLAVAIDGVGGYDGGEVAADIARTKIPQYLEVSSNGERLELLKRAVTSANNAIYKARTEDGKYPSMSCVLTSAIIDVERKEINMVHVGDTRLYCYHGGKLKKLSHDHSLVGYREEIGDLTEEEAMHHPQRNVINRDVGSAMHKTDDNEFIEAEIYTLLPNTILLLCSDGLTDLVTSAMISDVLGRSDTLEKKAQALIDMANNEGGKDNVTVVLVEYCGNDNNVAPIISQTMVNNEVSVENEEHPITVEKKNLKCINVCKWTIMGLVVLAAAAVAFACGYYLGKDDCLVPEPVPIEENTRSCSDYDDCEECYFYWLDKYYQEKEQDFSNEQNLNQ